MSIFPAKRAFHFTALPQLVAQRIPLVHICAVFVAIARDVTRFCQSKH